VVDRLLEMDAWWRRSMAGRSDGPRRDWRLFSANVPRLPPVAEASSLISLRRPASRGVARLADGLAAAGVMDRLLEMDACWRRSMPRRSEGPRRGRRVFSANVPRLPPAAEASSLISLRRPASRGVARLADGGVAAADGGGCDVAPCVMSRGSEQRLELKGSGCV